MEGPQSEIGRHIHAEKYREEGESFRSAMDRIASTLTESDPEFRKFREILMDMRFLPAGRIQAAIGSTKRVTPYNCFVSGPIADSFTEDEGSIMQRATEAAATMRMGGGIGYDFSTLRPRGDLIRKLGSRSSGPIAFMEIYDAVCRATASSGHRRGAQMGVMRIDHPDIEEFIRAKQNSDKLTGFNISVGVTDEFMACLLGGKPFWLRFEGRQYREVDPNALWDLLMRSAWDWAEPGVLFIDTINRRNNLYYCERIAATNPCGEQPLPPFGACLLGSFNLVRYVVGPAEAPDFNHTQLRNDIHQVVRSMDRVVDVATYPMREQENEARSKRRMGLGVTGLANAIEALGYPYGSPDFLRVQEAIMRTLRDEAYRASSLLAAERGVFPLYDDRFLMGEFVRGLPDDVIDLIRKNGIRNSHLTSIAPTGTISLAADNVSSGIEPVFAYEYDRTIQTFDGPKVMRVVDYGVAKLQTRGKPAKDVTVDEHLAVLLCAAKFTDSAVSKTCNVPPSTPWTEFKSIYSRAWSGGAKGCTTYQVGGKRFGVLNAQEDGTQVCTIDKETGRRNCE